MSGSVLASIIQNCKAHNKCFTSSPQDATPVQGLHSSAHRLGQKEVEEERGGRKRGWEARMMKRDRKGFLHFKAYKGNIENAGSYSF